MSTASGRYQAGTSTELDRLIGSLHKSMPELTGVMIASVDGLPVAHDFDDADAERIAAMAAAALGLGVRISERADLGHMAETVTRGSRGYLVVYAVGEEVVIVMSGPIDSNLGLMRMEARAASLDIKRILGTK